MEAIIQYCARQMLADTVRRLGYEPPLKARETWLRQYEQHCRKQIRTLGLLAGVGVVLFFVSRRKR